MKTIDLTNMPTELNDITSHAQLIKVDNDGTYTEDVALNVDYTGSFGDLDKKDEDIGTPATELNAINYGDPNDYLSSENLMNPRTK